MASPELVDAGSPGGRPADDEAEPAEEREPFDRSRDLLGRNGDTPIRRHLDKLFSSIVKGFEDQAERSDDLDKWWNIYNCVLDDEQFYQGNACVYVPIIRDAIEARVTRYSNQLFPATGRYISCTTSDGSQPFEVIALANHYIEDADLETQVVKPLLRNGDIEGQYNLYVDWCEFDRQIVSRETRPPMQDVMGVSVPIPDEEPEPDIEEEDIVEGRPVFRVLHDSDVLLLPHTAESVEQALQCGGSATIVWRWSDENVDGLEEAGEIRADQVEALKATRMGGRDMPGLSDLGKQLVKAVGIRGKGNHIIGLETWVMLPLNADGQFSEKKGKRRLCRVWFGVDRQQLGAKRNPFWNDLCPLLSRPQDKVAGVFKGKSKIEALAPVQYEANDAANERADVDHYGAMPIIADGRDGGTTNAPLILNLAAVWKVKPGDLQFMEFPDLSPRAKARIMDAYQIIFQSLNVNPSMLPQQTSASRRNQAQVAQEQQVDLLTTATGVKVVSAMLTDMVGWIADLDHQFRDGDLTVRMYGELGIQAEMKNVPALQNRARYRFRWVGQEQARMSMAEQQQLTALLNVARGMQQQLQSEGYSLRIGPSLERAIINVAGPEVGALTLIDQRHNLTIPAGEEDWMMGQGFETPVHPLDNDAEHLQSHARLMQETGDPMGNIRVHIQNHLKQLTAKNQAQVQAQAGGAMGMGAPGVPGGAGRGVAGTPRPGMPQPGAQPAMPRGLKQSPGAVHPDQMPRMGGGVVPMPRRM